MNQFFSIFARILTSLPFVVQTVEIIHQGESGASKLAVAKGIIQEGLTAAGSVVPEIAPMTQAAGPAIEAAINGVVATLNAFGVLKQPTAAGGTAAVATATAAASAALPAAPVAAAPVAAAPVAAAPVAAAPAAAAPALWGGK